MPQAPDATGPRSRSPKLQSVRLLSILRAPFEGGPGACLRNDRPGEGRPQQAIIAQTGSKGCLLAAPRSASRRAAQIRKEEP